MNPETNTFEMLVEKRKETAEELRQELARVTESVREALLRPDGSPVPKHWTVLSEGELVVVKDYTFRVVRIGETYMVLEPVRPEDALEQP